MQFVIPNQKHQTQNFYAQNQQYSLQDSQYLHALPKIQTSSSSIISSTLIQPPQKNMQNNLIQISKLIF